MIKDIRLGFSVIKYALNYNSIIFAFFFSVGVSLFCLLFLPLPIMSGLYIGLWVPGLVMSINSVTVSTMVQSSPYKKKLRTTVPAYFACMALIVGNTMCIGVHWLTYLRIKDNTPLFLSFVYDPETFASSIVVCAVIMVLLLLYTVMANVFFWTGTGLLVAMVIWFRWFDEPMGLIFWEISTEAAIVFSYVIVLLGSFALYILNCCIYRFQYSEWSYRSLLKRASK